MDIMVWMDIMHGYACVESCFGEKKRYVDVYGYVCVFLSHLIKTYLSLSH